MFWIFFRITRLRIHKKYFNLSLLKSSSAKSWKSPTTTKFKKVRISILLGGVLVFVILGRNSRTVLLSHFLKSYFPRWNNSREGQTFGGGRKWKYRLRCYSLEWCWNIAKDRNQKALSKGLKLVKKHMVDISHPGSTFPIGRRQWEIEMPGRLPRACANSPSLSFNLECMGYYAMRPKLCQALRTSFISQRGAARDKKRAGSS